MNLYEYKILQTVYDEIMSGNKKIEYRLLNEKSNGIKTGDMIKFKVLDNEDKFILVEVINKYIYEDVEELWSHKEVLSNSLGLSKEEFINTLYNIYGKEKVINSKIVGIEFKIKI